MTRRLPWIDQLISGGVRLKSVAQGLRFLYIQVRARMEIMLQNFILARARVFYQSLRRYVFI
jgi:hypothetical protein